MTLALGAFFEQHPLPHLVYEAQTLRIVAANAAAAQRYGYPVERLVGMSRLDLLDPAQADELRAFMRGLPESAGRQPQTVWRERDALGRRLHSDIRSVPWTPPGPASAFGTVGSLRLMVVMDAGPRAELLAASREQAGLFSVAERVGRVGGWRLDLATGRVMRSRVTWEVHGIEPPAGDLLSDDRYTPLRDALSFYPPEARETLRLALQRCSEHGEAFDLQLPFRNQQGQALWVRASGEPVRGAAGEIVALQGALQDITAFKQVEMALRDSQDRLRATIRAMPDLGLIFDAQDRYLEVSDPDHPSLSVDWSEKVGRPLQTSIAEPLASQMIESANRARRTGQVQAYHYQLITRSGGLRHFEARTVPLDDGRWMMLSRDVTETVDLERRFRRLAEALPVAIFESGPDGGTRWVNGEWQKLYGLTDEEALDSGWLAAIHPEDRDAVHAGWRASFRSRSAYGREYRIQRPDGSVRSVRLDSIPLLRADGELLGRIGVVVDITQDRELEEARRAREVAEEARRRQAAFMSRLSHELRTPLNAIIGFTELMILAEPPAGAPAEHPLPSEQLSRSTRLGHVRDAGKHMLALVDDLLELQRLQQPGTVLHLETVHLAEELQACVAMLEPLARSRQVRVDVSVDRPGAVLKTDRRAFRQVLLNLGSNAVKYGRVGGQVHLRALAPSSGATSAAGHWLIEVQDDGPGLTDPALQRLFQPFERLGRERTDQPGSGLGLVISRQLAELLEGSLDLSSRPGFGTTARLRLPAR